MHHVSQILIGVFLVLVCILAWIEYNALLIRARTDADAMYHTARNAASMEYIRLHYQGMPTHQIRSSIRAMLHRDYGLKGLIACEVRAQAIDAACLHIAQVETAVKKG